MRHRASLTLLAGFTAVSAYLGALGMVSGLLPVDHALAARLPLQSPVLGGLALALVVAVPTTLVIVLSYRRHPRAREAAALAGLLVVGWILVELAVVRQFSVLQPVYAFAGVGLVVLGDSRILTRVAEAASAVPLFLTAPLYRRWHLRWGATADEAVAVMPGDDLIPVSHFTATRAVTVEAPPEDVWPWLIQVGYRRAGFYSYDLLDNLGRPSADTIMSDWQDLSVGDVVAPMANPPTPDTSFVISELRPEASMVWMKPDSTWSWKLITLPKRRTRLVTRLKQHYRSTPAVPITVVLAEFGDFPMMRKMLLGIKHRAERPRVAASSDSPAVGEAQMAGQHLTTATDVRSSIDLYWLPLGAGGHSVRWNGRIYEALAAKHEGRPTQSLYHAALEVVHENSRYVIEMGPVWNVADPNRDVVCEGPVGARWLGRSRMFRYEVRCWRNGRIPDIDEAVDSPRHLSNDGLQAETLLEIIRHVPPLTWGRDEIHSGDMWNSNSLVAWLLAMTGHDMSSIQPPAGGRAPGWNAGLALASRSEPSIKDGQPVR